jgi:hypothetical protein
VRDLDRDMSSSARRLSRRRIRLRSPSCRTDAAVARVARRKAADIAGGAGLATMGDESASNLHHERREQRSDREAGGEALQCSGRPRDGRGNHREVKASSVA